MTRKKTHEEFVMQINNLVGNNIYEFLDHYKGIEEPIRTRHIPCGYVWYPRPNDLLSNRNKNQERCPFCNQKIKLTTEKFQELVSNIVGNEYEVIGEYKSKHTKIEIHHIVCKTTYKVTPNHFLYGNRCPYCSGNLKRNTGAFSKLLLELGNGEYELKSEYVNAHTNVVIHHKTCLHDYNVSPNNFICGQRCPYCNKISKGEQRIADLLVCNGLSYVYQYSFKDCRYEKPLPFDFAIFDKGILSYLIEYDGIQHFEPVDFAGKGEEWAVEMFKQNQIKDNIKNEYCKNNNIVLLRIPYWEFDNIEKILNSHSKLLVVN
jgi:hypothetical protein